MPATIPLAAFVFGAILVLIAIVGGNIELSGIKISANAGKAGRFVAGVLGVSFIVLALWLYLLPSSSTQGSPTSVAQTGTTAPIVAPASTPAPVRPTSVPPTSVPPTAALPTAMRPTNTVALPTATSCSTAIGSHLQEAKPKIAPSRCPKGTEQSAVNYAIQQFEHGWMLEPFVDRHDVYVLFESSKKTWKQFQEDWEAQGGPPDSCKDIQPTGNKTKPISGFGQVWCGRSPTGGLSPDDRLSIGYGNYVGFGNPPMLYFQELDDNTIMFGGAPLPVNQYVSNVSGTVIFILSSDHSWNMVGGVP